MLKGDTKEQMVNSFLSTLFLAFVTMDAQGRPATNINNGPRMVAAAGVTYRCHLTVIDDFRSRFSPSAMISYEAPGSWLNLLVKRQKVIPFYPNLIFMHPIQKMHNYYGKRGKPHVFQERSLKVILRARTECGLVRNQSNDWDLMTSPRCNTFRWFASCGSPMHG